MSVMCGRFVGSFSTQDIHDELFAAVEGAGLRLELPDTDLPLLHNFNVAPTHAVPILRVVDGAVIVDVMGNRLTALTGDACANPCANLPEPAQLTTTHGGTKANNGKP